MFTLLVLLQLLSHDANNLDNMNIRQLTQGWENWWGRQYLYFGRT